MKQKVFFTWFSLALGLLGAMPLAGGQMPIPCTNADRLENGGRAAKGRILASLLVMSPGLIFSGYMAIRRASIAVLYQEALLPESQVLSDIPYAEEANEEKHRLDLFLPQGTDWPILIFVHGGRLASGDKRLRVGGADVYGNIGRFYASHGIGVAVINYRLQPKVTWRDQVADVARSTAWVFANAGTYGGNPHQLFLSGHSAGAQLAARVALDPKPLAQFGLSPAIVRGVIAISGAGFDLTDSRTYELGQTLSLYEARLRDGDPTEQWKTEASPITFIKPGAPPFLILCAEGETESLKRQSHLLHEALQQQGNQSELRVVPGQSHCRIVLTLSRPDKTSAPAILKFIERTSEHVVCQSGSCSIRVEVENRNEMPMPSGASAGRY